MQSKSIIAGNRHRLFGLREPFSCFLCLTLLKFFDTLRRNQRLMENGTFPIAYRCQKWNRYFAVVANDAIQAAVTAPVAMQMSRTIVSLSCFIAVSFPCD